MLKKSIAYEDYNGNEVVEDFYFNFTKLEVLEMMELEDLEANIQRLTETEDAREAYELFKQLILRAYGVKSDDGKRFIKDPTITKEFEQSPALSELVIEFLQDPKQGATFIEQTLPAKMVAEAKAAQAKNPSQEEIKELVQTAAARQDDPATAIKPGDIPEELRTTATPAENKTNKTKKFEDYSQQELLDMPQEDFQALVGSDPRKMTQQQLYVAFQRKNQ